MYRNVIKPFFDIVSAFFLLLITMPLWLILIVLLLIANHGKPFFTQPRPGKNNVIFKVIKFKTMTDELGKDGKLLSDDERLTWVGRFIRKASLDELPQLFNVITGKMSLVGPRPLLVDYLPLYDLRQIKRHEVKPGITGWAQVNGRNTLLWEEKFEYDVWYVKNQSFILDIRILFLTFIKVIKAEGISGEGTQTMQRFTGNSKKIGE